MPASVPRDSTLAVVGDGFGSLIVYATAIYLGYRPEEIAIFGTNDNAVGTYQQFAHNLGQTVLRSESESHFLPADWPTFAHLDAWSRRSPKPLYRSIKRKYNPGVPDILAEASVVQRRLGWEHVRVPRRVRRPNGAVGRHRVGRACGGARRPRPAVGARARCRPW